MKNHLSVGMLVTTALAGLLFLVPWSYSAVHAQQDDKDIIKQLRLKEEIERQQKEFEATQKQQQAETARFKQENDRLMKAIRERDLKIIMIEAEVKKLRLIAKNFEEIAQTRQQMIAILVDEIRTLIAGKEARLGKDVLRNVNDPNPPKDSVTGVIEKIDPKDPSLVTISIGADVGLAKNHTLDVYRLKPQPKHLGMIRILDVTPHKAVGRMTNPRHPLEVGDKVTSRLSK